MPTTAPPRAHADAPVAARVDDCRCRRRTLDHAVGLAASRSPPTARAGDRKKSRAGLVLGAALLAGGAATYLVMMPKGPRKPAAPAGRAAAAAHAGGASASGRSQDGHDPLRGRARRRARLRGSPTRKDLGAAPFELKLPRAGGKPRVPLPPRRATRTRRSTADLAPDRTLQGVAGEEPAPPPPAAGRRRRHPPPPAAHAETSHRPAATAAPTHARPARPSARRRRRWRRQVLSSPPVVGRLRLVDGGHAGRVGGWRRRWRWTSRSRKRSGASATRLRLSR